MKHNLGGGGVHAREDRSRSQQFDQSKRAIGCKRESGEKAISKNLIGGRAAESDQL